MKKKAKANSSIAKPKKKIPFASKKFEDILAANAKAMVAHAHPEAVHLALKAKHGCGLLGYRGDDAQAIAEMRDAMAPLVAILEFEATASFVRVFGNMLAVPECKSYLRRKSAAALGTMGGRPKGDRAPHIEWLERAMRTAEAEYRDVLPKISAKEHFKELRSRPEIDGEDENGDLTFTPGEVDKYVIKEGQKEPVITLSAVTKMLTRIRKDL